MSRRSQLAALLVAGAAFVAGASVPQMTQAHSAARHQQAHSVLHAKHRRSATLRTIAAALAPPAGTILHERAMITTPGHAPALFELWAQIDAPQAYRVIKWGHEGAWNGSAFSNYDAQTNTVTISPAGQQPGRSHGPVDFASSLRALVQSGQARVTGTSTVHGVPAYDLSVGSNGDVLPPGSSAYVSESDYRPLVIDYNANGGETISFEAYEYLPGNTANLALLDLAAQHPGARVIQRTEETSTTSSG
jgi:hypothetical protein